ncbi:MAG: hypothetical protein AB8H80_09245 [Planctomycetota bacterium]
MTTYEDEGEEIAYSSDRDAPAAQGYATELAVPVAIAIPDLGTGKDRLLIEFYSGVLRRLEDAANDGNVPLIDSLVESYDKPSAPEPIRQQLCGYRAVARGIAFQQHVARHAQLRLRGDAGKRKANDAPATGRPAAPPLGKPLELELVVPAMAKPVLLGCEGDQDSFGFWVAVTIDDEFADGSSTSSRRRGFVGLPNRLELTGDIELILPIDVDVAAGRSARRSVLVRVDMMPGHAMIDGVRAPLQRRNIGAATWTQWPKGVDLLAERPLEALRTALADFRPGNHAAVYLAAQLMPAEKRKDAAALLMDQVRFGSDDQARVATAALRELTGVSIAIGHRDGWLEWWQARR